MTMSRVFKNKFLSTIVQCVNFAFHVCIQFDASFPRWSMSPKLLPLINANNKLTHLTILANREASFPFPLSMLI